jgi:hypothetical protein
LSPIAKPALVHLLLSASLLLFGASPAAGEPAIYTARGITVTAPHRAQQNTLDAIMAIAQWNSDRPANPIAGCEIHVVVTRPPAGEAPQFVLSHDVNLLRLTGQDLLLPGLGREQIQSLQIRQVLDGIDYGRTRPFAFLEELLERWLEHGPPPFSLWLNVKEPDYRPWDGPSHAAEHLVPALAQWRLQGLRRHGVDMFHYLIVSADNPFVVDALDKKSKALRLEDVLDIFPDYFSWGIPQGIWRFFIDELGGFEWLFGLESRWAAFEHPFLDLDLISRYHATGRRVIGWGTLDPLASYYKSLDAALHSY